MEVSQIHYFFPAFRYFWRQGAQIKRFNYDVQFQSWCWEADFFVGWRLQFFLLHALLWLPCVVLSCWRILGLTSSNVPWNHFLILSPQFAQTCGHSVTRGKSASEDFDKSMPSAGDCCRRTMERPLEGDGPEKNTATPRMFPDLLAGNNGNKNLFQLFYRSFRPLWIFIISIIGQGVFFRHVFFPARANGSFRWIFFGGKLMSPWIFSGSRGAVLLSSQFSHPWCGGLGLRPRNLVKEVSTQI